MPSLAREQVTSGQAIFCRIEVSYVHVEVEVALYILVSWISVLYFRFSHFISISL